MRLKKRNFLCVVLSLVLCMGILPAPVLAEETGSWTDGVIKSPGEGYSENGDTVTISSAEGLAWLSVQVNGLNGVEAKSFAGKTIVLSADIDLAGKLWTPIGAGTYPSGSFNGNFDGANHTISNMTIYANNQERYIGLFGEVGLGGDKDNLGYIRNISLTNVSVTTENVKAFGYAGTLIGECISGYGEISGCTASGKITCKEPVSNFYAGGLIGFINPLISGDNISLRVNACHANVEIMGAPSYAGGFAGLLHDGGMIENCGAAGNISVSGSYISQGSSVGGFLGALEPVNLGPIGIRNCYAGGDVSVDSEDTNYVGGFLGSADYCGANNSFLMESCMSSGNVFLISESDTGAMKFGGGFAGSIMGQGTTRNCYATGDVLVSNSSVASIGGGFAGNVQGIGNGINISDCYEAGNVTVSGGGINRAFGFSGNTPAGTFENCFALGTQMKAEGSRANAVSPFLLGDYRNVTVQQCCYNKNMDFGTLSYVDGGQLNPDALEEAQLKERLQILAENNPAWKLGNDGYPILENIREDVQQTEQLDYLYPKITIQISASPLEGGTAAGEGSYQKGEEVMVTATPGTGYRFVRWTENGTEVSVDPVYRFTASDSRTLTAEFEKVPEAESYEITVSANAVERGTVTGGGIYTAGVTATVTAIPNSGYRFIHWTEGGTKVSESAGYSFTVSGNRILTAEFEADENYNPVTPKPPVNPEENKPAVDPIHVSGNTGGHGSESGTESTDDGVFINESSAASPKDDPLMDQTPHTGI